MTNLSQLIIPCFLKHSLLQPFMPLLNLPFCLHLCYLILKQSCHKSLLSPYTIYTLCLNNIQESIAFSIVCIPMTPNIVEGIIHQYLIGISKFSQTKQNFPFIDIENLHSIPSCFSASSQQCIIPPCAIFLKLNLKVLFNSCHCLTSYI